MAPGAAGPEELEVHGGDAREERHTVPGHGGERRLGLEPLEVAQRGASEEAGVLDACLPVRVEEGERG